MNIEQKALEVAKLRRRACDAAKAGDDDTWLELVLKEFKAISILREAVLDKLLMVIKNSEARKVLENSS